jgi:hypothetical protein
MIILIKLLSFLKKFVEKDFKKINEKNIIFTNKQILFLTNHFQ